MTDLDLPGDEEKPTEKQEPIDADEITTGYSHALVKAKQQTDSLTKPFRDSLIKLDEAKGTGLLSVFDQAVRFQDNNEMLRANLYQMQTLFQGTAREWVDIKALLKDMASKKKVTDRDFLETMKQIVDLNEKTTKSCTQIIKQITQTTREIRLGEMADRNHYHVSKVAMLTTSLTALLFKHLQGTEFLTPIMKGLRDLTEIFSIRSSTQEE